MTDEQLEEQLQLARRASPAFGLARQQRVIWGARRRLQKARFSSRQLLPLVAAACVVSAAFGSYLWFSSARSAPTTPSAVDERWQLRDGSRIIIETPQTQITKTIDSQQEVLFELMAGAARFDVAHRPERAFRVQAGQVRVEVVGTAFRVERKGAGAAVSVSRGRVRVSWSSRSRELAAGEQGVFPPADVSAIVPPLTASPPSSAVAPSDTHADSPARAAAGGPEPLPPSAEALFAEADLARAAGRPLDATRALQQLTARYPRNARAPFAAFTLGRLLLENLGKPADAARAFAQARALAGPQGPLAEDALAREVEAWQAAGNSAEAARRSELYRNLYPNGVRLKQVVGAGRLPPHP